MALWHSGSKPNTAVSMQTGIMCNTHPLLLASQQANISRKYKLNEKDLVSTRDILIKRKELEEEE